MADAYGSGPYGRKSLRVQLPSRPFIFLGLFMRKYGYHRPSVVLYKRRRVRSKKPSFFLKFFFSLLILLGIGWGGFIGVRYGYHLIKNAQIADWHVKSVSVFGVSGAMEKEMLSKVAVLEGKPFSGSQAEDLREEFVNAYPMLKNITVVRGLLTGKLKISAKQREPVAQFVLPGGARRYIDSDSIVYADANGPQDVPHVQLVGPVPEKLQPSFVEVVQSILKLKKSLPFKSLQLNLQENTVDMRLTDDSLIRFGATHSLKAKAMRAAQIMDKVRRKYSVPITLNFEFFEQGKVFLTLPAH